MMAAVVWFGTSRMYYALERAGFENHWNAPHFCPCRRCFRSSVCVRYSYRLVKRFLRKNTQKKRLSPLRVSARPPLAHSGICVQWCSILQPSFISYVCSSLFISFKIHTGFLHEKSRVTLQLSLLFLTCNDNACSKCKTFNPKPHNCRCKCINIFTGCCITKFDVNRN